jgi:hypothetical protein
MRTVALRRPGPAGIRAQRLGRGPLRGRPVEHRPHRAVPAGRPHDAREHGLRPGRLLRGPLPPGGGHGRGTPRRAFGVRPVAHHLRGSHAASPEGPRKLAFLRPLLFGQFLSASSEGRVRRRPETAPGRRGEHGQVGAGLPAARPGRARDHRRPSGAAGEGSREHGGRGAFRTVPGASDGPAGSRPAPARRTGRGLDEPVPGLLFRGAGRVDPAPGARGAGPGRQPLDHGDPVGPAEARGGSPLSAADLPLLHRDGQRQQQDVPRPRPVPPGRGRRTARGRRPRRPRMGAFSSAVRESW